MESLKIMIFLSVVAAKQRLNFQPSGQNNQEKLNMDLARLQFCWRNSQDHLKNSLCLPGMEQLPVITKINTRHGLNRCNLQLNALCIRVNTYVAAYISCL